MTVQSSRAEMRLAAIYSALICTAAVLALNVFVLNHSGNHSALFGTWIDRLLQQVSATTVAAVLTAPIALAGLRQVFQGRWVNAIILTFCLTCTAFSVWMLVIMLQD